MAQFLSKPFGMTPNGEKINEYIISNPGAPTPGPPGLFSAYGAELTKKLSKYWIDSLKKCQHRRRKL